MPEQRMAENYARASPQIGIFSANYGDAVSVERERRRRPKFPRIASRPLPPPATTNRRPE